MPWTIGRGIHCCLIYDDDLTRLDTISKFIADGMSNGAVAKYLRASSDEEWQKLMDAIRARGLTEDQLTSGLHSEPAEDFYCPFGEFHPRDVWRRLLASYEDEKSRGEDYVLLSGEMEWALNRGPETINQLPVYEQGVNDVIKHAPFSIICQYDARKFDAEIIEKIIHAHPFVVVGSEILINPNYTAD